MDIGSHIPTCLLCDRFARGSRILALHPPDDMCLASNDTSLATDDKGLNLLSHSAEQIVIVMTRPIVSSSLSPDRNIHRLVAASNSLPFKPGSFDLVLCLQLPFDRPNFDLEAELRIVKQQTNPTGICVVRIPNRETLSRAGVRDRHIPDFLEFERTLRRFFPHTTLFAQQPLYGATLSPLGRRKEESPLLDDRLLPEEGESPDYFVGIGCSTWRRLDDITIAQVPFRPVVDAIQLQMEKLEGTIGLIQKEKKARDNRIDELTVQIDEMTADLSGVDLLRGEKSALAARITWLTEQQLHRDRVTAELEQRLEQESLKRIELETEADRIRRSERHLEQQISDLERKAGQDTQSLTESETRQEEMHRQLYDIQAQLRQRIRQVDDGIERIAEKEAELEILNRDFTALRQELQQTREQNRVLTLQTAEQQSETRSIQNLEADLRRLRTLLETEKQRMDDALSREHSALLETIVERDDARRELHRTERQITELTLTISEKQTKTESSEEQCTVLTERMDQLQQEKRDLHLRNRELETRIHELEEERSQREDENKRQAHTNRLLSARAEDAETRSGVLQSRVSVIEQELSALEKTFREQQPQLERTYVLEDQNNELQERCTHLERELAQADGQCRDARFHTESMDQLQSRYDESQQLVRKLRNDIADGENRFMELEVRALRLEQLENRYRAAFEQIDVLQRELEALRPTAAAARARSDQFESSHQQLQTELATVRADVDTWRDKADRLEKDFLSAMEALAEIEEGADIRVHNAAERIRSMKSEIDRLKTENETELLLVREDLETELRLLSRQLDEKNQDIWELRDEVTRLQAQSAASAAYAREEGIHADLQNTLLEQESMILELQEDRKRLRREIEKKVRSLEIRRRNMRILAAILRREHQANLQLQTGEIVDTALDIGALIAEQGGNVEADQLDFLAESICEEMSRADPSEKQLPDSPSAARPDDAIVDMIMGSPIVRTRKDPAITVVQLSDEPEDASE